VTQQLDGSQKRLVAQVTDRLENEFAGTFSAETIERFIADAQADLESRARVATWLPILVERFARERLRALARVEHPSPGTPAVLFLCVHNAGRSQMAAGWMRHLAGDGVDVYSGGSDPGSDVNAMAIEAMGEVGIDIAREFPKPWSDEEVRAADVVVTMGCGDACPVFPGKRYLDWELTDPAGQPIEVVREVRGEIETRVRRLLDELGVATRS
jgi:arsenate reductase